MGGEEGHSGGGGGGGGEGLPPSIMLKYEIQLSCSKVFTIQQ